MHRAWRVLGALLAVTAASAFSPAAIHPTGAPHLFYTSPRFPVGAVRPAGRRAAANAAAQPGAGETEGGKVRIGTQYDPELLRAYFLQNPGELFYRAWQLLAAVGGVVAANTVSAVQGRRGQDIIADNAQQISDTLASLGPTFSKFGQAASSRPDLVGGALASALCGLTDDIPPFDHALARSIIKEDLTGLAAAAGGAGIGAQELLASIGDITVAAASLGQVYKARVGGEWVAVKVQRPGVVRDIAADSVLVRAGAAVVEGLRNPLTGERLAQPELVAAVDEFFQRLFEEADYLHEAENMHRFDALYGKGGLYSGVIPRPGVVVPRVLRGLSTSRVLTMEWIEGTKLAANSTLLQQDLPLLKLGIACTLSQMLESGFMHADPHGGNLMRTANDPPQLAYLDFGLVSEVPLQVREGLLRAVAYMVARDMKAVAALFGDLMLIPQDILDDPAEFAEFEKALTNAADLVLPRVPEGDANLGTRVPQVQFDKLLEALLPLVPRFKFTLPPYFLNNARAIGTLEGLAKSADPSFNVLAVVYSFAVRALFKSRSPGMRKTLRDLTYDKKTGKPDWGRMKLLIADAAMISGVRKRRIVWDAALTVGGQKFVWGALRDQARRKRRETSKEVL